jgi:SAM-dependent methyltransferase
VFGGSGIVGASRESELVVPLSTEVNRVGYERSAQFYDCFDTKGNLDFYLELAERTEGAVLELGVGTGRVLFEIAKTRRDVVGIDNSVEMLREAKRKRREDYPEIAGRCRLLKADMLSFDLGSTFGLVYSASGGVQGDSAEDLRGIFRGAAQHLVEGGLFAFDVASPSALKRTLSYPPEQRELPEGRVVIRFVAQTYCEGDDAATFDLLYKEHIPGRTVTETYLESGVVAVITPYMIELALEYAGLSIESLAGDFDGGPYTEDSKWIVVVARK